MIHLLVHKLTPRILYIADFVGSRLGIKLECTTSPKFEDERHCINYTDQKIPQSIQVYNSKFLEESSLDREFEPDCLVEDELVQLFTSSSTCTISFDIFASIFYCISRYEEYQDFVPDQHSRFPASASHAYKKGYLVRPIVDEWLVLLRQKIQTAGFIEFVQPRQVEVIPTIDVDVSWAYKHRSLSHRIGSQLKKIVKGEIQEWKEQRVAYQSGKDPFDTFDYLRDQCQYLESRYFFLCRESPPYDTAYFLKKAVFAKLIQDLSKNNVIGLHPSYSSFDDVDKLKEEKRWLENVIGSSVKSSRQHFLRFTLPDTYIRLSEIGILDDFSMGYADHAGFRAGTSMPFYFYDLNKEQVTGLTVHPFCLMDVSLKNYQKLSTEEALKFVRQTKKKIQEVNGQLCFIWHNSSFSILGGWQGWDTVFEELVKSEKNDNT